MPSKTGLVFNICHSIPKEFYIKEIFKQALNAAYVEI
jgi:hypothetical protein